MSVGLGRIVLLVCMLSSACAVELVESDKSYCLLTVCKRPLVMVISMTDVECDFPWYKCDVLLSSGHDSAVPLIRSCDN